MSRPEHGTVTDTIERESAGGTTVSRRAESSGETTDGSTAFSKDAVFDVLRNRRRRLVLEFLRERGTSTLPDVAEHVAAVENEKEVRHLTSSERKRVYVGLYQCHLPMLADAGVVDYDANRKTIELRERSSLLYPYLDLDVRDGPTRDGPDNGWLWNWRRSLRSLLDRG